MEFNHCVLIAQKGLQHAACKPSLHQLPHKLICTRLINSASPALLVSHQNTHRQQSHKLASELLPKHSLHFSLPKLLSSFSANHTLFKQSLSINRLSISTSKGNIQITNNNTKGELVYKGAISGMIKSVKIFSLSTSFLGLCFQPMFWFNEQAIPLVFKVAFGGIINFCIFLNPFIIHYIAKKYVLDLYWNQETGVFVASTWSFLVRRKEIQFMAEDVKVPDIPGMFTFMEAKGVPLFIEPQAFLNNDAYVHLMGFNKPLDWELPQQGTSSEKENS